MGKCKFTVRWATDLQCALTEGHEGAHEVQTLEYAPLGPVRVVETSRSYADLDKVVLHPTTKKHGP